MQRPTTMFRLHFLGAHPVHPPLANESTLGAFTGGAGKGARSPNTVKTILNGTSSIRRSPGHTERDASRNPSGKPLGIPNKRRAAVSRPYGTPSVGQPFLPATSRWAIVVSLPRDDGTRRVRRFAKTEYGRLCAVV